MNQLIRITILLTITLVIGSGCASQAFAANTLKSVVASRTAVVKENVLEKLKTKAGVEINRRIITLTNLQNRLASVEKLNQSDKTLLLSQINSEASGLGALKDKIDSDQNLPTLRTDVKSITESYRVYLLIVPKTHLLVASARVSFLADKLAAASTQLGTKITAAKNAGQDVTSLEAALADLNAKVANAKSLAATANQTLLPITPDQYNANKTLIQAPRSALKTAQDDLKAARDDAKTIISSLKLASTTTTSN